MVRPSSVGWQTNSLLETLYPRLSWSSCQSVVKPAWDFERQWPLVSACSVAGTLDLPSRTWLSSSPHHVLCRSALLSCWYQYWSDRSNSGSTAMLSPSSGWGRMYEIMVRNKEVLSWFSRHNIFFFAKCGEELTTAFFRITTFCLQRHVSNVCLLCRFLRWFFSSSGNLPLTGNNSLRVGPDYCRNASSSRRYDFPS